jgi:hypothetical protein
MEWFAHRGDFSVPQFAYSPKCVEEEFCELRLYGVLTAGCGRVNPSASHAVSIQLSAISFFLLIAER